LIHFFKVNPEIKKILNLKGMLNQIQGTSGKIIMAALAGITAGMIAGVLMAPRTGSSLRNELSQNALRVKNKINKAFKEYYQQQQLPEAE
jgi:gas vesicle protein